MKDQLAEQYIRTIVYKKSLCVVRANVVERTNRYHSQCSQQFGLSKTTIKHMLQSIFIIDIH